MLIKEGAFSEIVFLAVIAASVLYHLYLLYNDKKLPEIRSFPAIDAIPDAIDRCYEQGKNVVFSAGSSATFRGLLAAATVASMNILRYVARESYRRGVRLITICPSNPDAVPLQDAIHREAAILEGNPSVYNRETDLRFYGRGYVLGFGSTIERENIGATICFGALSGGDECALESSQRVNSIIINGSLRWIQYCAIPFTCDYMLIMDEVYAAAALVSGDRAAIATVASGDIPDLFVMGVMVVLLVLALAGIPVDQWLAL